MEAPCRSYKTSALPGFAQPFSFIKKNVDEKEIPTDEIQRISKLVFGFLSPAFLS
jgi:hypothetical protein